MSPFQEFLDEQREAATRLQLKAQAAFELAVCIGVFVGVGVAMALVKRLPHPIPLLVHKAWR